jgi:hypothetical protein
MIVNPRVNKGIHHHYRIVFVVTPRPTEHAELTVVWWRHPLKYCTALLGNLFFLILRICIQF